MSCNQVKIVCEKFVDLFIEQIRSGNVIITYICAVLIAFTHRKYNLRNTIVLHFASLSDFGILTPSDVAHLCMHLNEKLVMSID